MLWKPGSCFMDAEWNASFQNIYLSFFCFFFCHFLRRRTDRVVGGRGLLVLASTVCPTLPQFPAAGLSQQAPLFFLSLFFFISMQNPQRHVAASSAVSLLFLATCFWFLGGHQENRLCNTRCLLSEKLFFFLIVFNFKKYLSLKKKKINERKKMTPSLYQGCFSPRASRGRFSGLNVATGASFWWQDFPDSCVFGPESGKTLLKAHFE